MRKLKPGDFWRICEKSGFRVPASETVREWTGAIVWREFFEPRHPQDAIRVRRREDMRVPDPRPRPVDIYAGPLNTDLSADAAAGATSLTVDSTSRFLTGDRIGVFLDNGDRFLAIVQSVDSATALTLAATTPLPVAASAGNKVINYTAVATTDLG
jgi:hypothetical protein